VRYWRALLWLLPLATAIPLGIFVYQLITSDFSAYFGGVKLVGLIFVLGIPNIVILGASVTAAMIALRGNPVAALVVLAAVSAIQLTMLLWSPEFWDAHGRPEYLVAFAVPGTVAWLLGISGVVLLHDSNRLAAMIAAGLLLVPVLSSAGAVVNYGQGCPSGPSVDLTFSGLENAHFTSSCGTPRSGSTLAQCTSNDVTLELFDWGWWSLSFHPYSRTVTSDEFPSWAPSLIVGVHTGYGGPWTGSYTFDPSNHCAGTVDANLRVPGGSPQSGYVHVSGHFEAPAGTAY
jgi:hypothetical protein